MRSLRRAPLILAVALFAAAVAHAQAASSATPPLVTPAWVAQHATDPNVRVLDVRPNVHDYLSGHVPNAVYLADSALRAPLDGTPVQFLDDAQLGQLFQRAGVKDGDHVVVYSDGENVLGATMVAYALERIGHPNVSVLDGGFTGYQKSGAAVSQNYPKYTPSKLTVKPDPSLRVTLAEVERLRNQPGVVLIDARPSSGYSGQVKTWQRNGHIPGALNVDWHQLMTPGNLHQFKPADQIRSILTRAGVDTSKQLIVYCGTGREATAELFALRHLVNAPNVRLYEGSWTEWSSHGELPVATGMTPQSGIGGAGTSGEGMPMGGGSQSQAQPSPQQAQPSPQGQAEPEGGQPLPAPTSTP